MLTSIAIVLFYTFILCDHLTVPRRLFNCFSMSHALNESKRNDINKTAVK